MERASTSKEQLNLTETLSCETSEAETECNEDPNFEVPRSLKKKKKKSSCKIKNIFQVSFTCDRTGVSDRPAAIIASSVLHDIEGCHTQAVERCVKLVTEASSLVCSSDARDGLIRSRIESRQKMPSFETKRQFVV